MGKVHFKLYKAGKKWCVMGIVALTVAFGTFTFADTDNVKAATQQQITEAQDAVGGLQQQYNQQTGQLKQDQQSINDAQSTVAEAQDKEKIATDNLNKAQNSVKQAQQELQQKQQEQGSAAGRIEQDKANISKEESNVTVANNNLKAAQDNETVSQKDVNEKAADVQQKQQDVDKKQTEVDQKQSKVNNTNSQINKLNDQIEHNNQFQVPNDYAKKIINGTSLDEADVKALNQNTYHHSNQAAQISFADLNDLSQQDRADLSTFAAGLINDIRVAMGQSPLQVTHGSVSFGKDSANNYLKHNYIDSYNQKGSIVDAANENGLWNFREYVKLNGNLNRQVTNWSQSSISFGNFEKVSTSYTFTPITMDSLKEDTYKMILNGLCNSKNARNFLNGGDFLAITGMDQELDLLIISNDDISNNSSFDKTKYAIPSTDTSELQNQLLKLKDLKKDQVKQLTTTQNDLTLVRQSLQSARGVLKTAQNNLDDAKKNVADKEKLLAVAKDQLKEAEDILTSDQRIADGADVKKATTHFEKVKADQEKT